MGHLVQVLEVCCNFDGFLLCGVSRWCYQHCEWTCHCKVGLSPPLPSHCRQHHCFVHPLPCPLPPPVGACPPHLTPPSSPRSTLPWSDRTSSRCPTATKQPSCRHLDGLVHQGGGAGWDYHEGPPAERLVVRYVRRNALKGLLALEGVSALNCCQPHHRPRRSQHSTVTCCLWADPRGIPLLPPSSVSPSPSLENRGTLWWSPTSNTISWASPPPLATTT